MSSVIGVNDYDAVPSLFKGLFLTHSSENVGLDVATWGGWARIPQADFSSNSKRNKIKLSKRNDLHTSLKNQLSQVLSIMAEVHESIQQGQYSQFQTQVLNMIKQLDQIQVFKEPQLTYHQRNYLARQLHTIKENLRFVISSKNFQDQSMEVFRKVNEELIHISQIYSLDKQFTQQYSVYFCSQTESTWIQKSIILFKKDIEIVVEGSVN